jgi:soluble P-type ATPase
VPIQVDLPGTSPIVLDQLVLDVNGTLTDRGALLDGVADRIRALRDRVAITIATADTFGNAADVARDIGVDLVVVRDGADKAALVETVGPDRCVAIGNGNNDVAMLERARLAVAVLGREGSSARAVAVADVVCLSVNDALDLLLEPRSLAATLRP